MQDVVSAETALTFTVDQTACVITLGAPQKVTMIEGLLKKNPSEDAFTSFRSRILKTIQTLSSEPEGTIAINDSQEVRSITS